MSGSPRGGDDAADPDVVLDERRLEVLRRHALVVADTGDGETPLTASHAFRPPPDMTPAQGLGLVAAMLLVGLSGFASDLVLAWTGVRPFALLLLAVATGAAAGLGGRGGGAFIGGIERAAVIAVLLAALVTGATLPLLLLPAVVHAAVAHVLLASTRDEVSLVERGARLSHPLAPAFIGPYCRRLTAVWAFLFAKSALVTALLAVTGDLAAHRAWTLWQFWTLLGVFSALEFTWRKAWFRYFGRGPLDRFLRRLFPPEATARGRRSQAYLERMRAELARLAEEERRRRSGASGRSEG